MRKYFGTDGIRRIALLNQNYKNIEIIIIDNDSTDSSVKIIEDNFKEKVVLFKNKNTGYAGGANKGIELSNGEYVIIANPDIVEKIILKSVLINFQKMKQ